MPCRPVQPARAMLTAMLLRVQESGKEERGQCWQCRLCSTATSFVNSWSCRSKKKEILLVVNLIARGAAEKLQAPTNRAFVSVYSGSIMNEHGEVRQVTKDT